MSRRSARSERYPDVVAIPTVTLMPPTLVAQPVHHAGWVYEEKYDGWRMVAYKDADQVRLISRQGKGLHAPLPRAGCRYQGSPLLHGHPRRL